MEIDGLIGEILRRRPELTKEEVLRQAKKRMGEIPHISEYTAVLLVAVDLGVKLSLDVPSSTALNKLVEGLNNVTVRGRVLWVQGQREFRRRDGRVGVYVRAGIGDSTGFRDVIFWDRTSKSLEEDGFLEGGVTEISMAMTRKSLSGAVELHVGARGEVKDIPEEEANFPSTESFLVPISEVSAEETRVHCYGRVVGNPLVTEFTRKDGERGAVSRYGFTDGKAVRRLVLWDDALETYDWIKPGAVLTVFNGRPRLGLTGDVEVHVGKTSQITLYTGIMEPLSFTPTFLGDLKEGFNDALIFVRVNGVGLQRTSSTEKPVVSIYGLDSSTDATITFIGEVARKVSRVKIGAVLSVKGMRLRLRGEDRYLLCDDSSEVEVDPVVPKASDLPRVYTDFTSLSEVSAFNRMVNVEGTVVKAPIEEDPYTPGFQKRGELYIEEDGKPAKVTYLRAISDYSKEKLALGDKVKIFGAQVDAPGFLEEAHYVPLRLRAYSKIEKEE